MNVRKVMCILVIILIFLSGCVNQNKKGYNGTEEIPYSVTNCEQLSFNEQIEAATHIADAIFLGSEKDGVYSFKIVNVMKGEIKDDIINVYVENVNDEGIHENYEIGTCYLLLLEKNLAVYRPYLQYLSIPNQLTDETNSDWQEKHDIINAAKDGFDITVKEYGIPFIISDSLEEVVSFSSDVFVVNIKSEFGRSHVYPTTVYYCIVKDCLKGNHVENSEIKINFFNDTVRPNNDYIILLKHTEDGSVVYALSSPDMSVFDISRIDEIKNILEVTGNN